MPKMEPIHVEKYIFKELGENKDESRMGQGRQQGGEKDVLERQGLLESHKQRPRGEVNLSGWPDSV